METLAIIILLILVLFPLVFGFFASLRRIIMKTDETPISNNKKVSKKKLYIFAIIYPLLFFGVLIWLFLLIGQNLGIDLAVGIFITIWSFLVFGGIVAISFWRRRRIHPPGNDAPLSVYNEFLDAQQLLWRQHWKRYILEVILLTIGDVGILVLGIFLLVILKV